MTISRIGKKVEKNFDHELNKCWEIGGEKYHFELVAPGTRTEADFRIQINVYKVAKRGKNKDVHLEFLNYIKVDISKLKSLDVPKFFLKIGNEIKEYVDRRENRPATSTSIE